MSTPVATTEFELLQADFQDLIDQRSAIESQMEGMHSRLSELGRIAALEELASSPFPKSIKTEAYLGLNGDFVGEALGLEGEALNTFAERLEALDDITVEVLINEDLSFSFGPVTLVPSESEGSSDL